MRVATIGTGYVGLVTGACLADLGHSVTCVDVVAEKVDKINRGEPPIYEEGLSKLLKKHVGKRLTATLDCESAIKNADVSMICVGTPSRGNGEIDLSFIQKAAADVGRALPSSGYHTVVVKSSVTPGTTDSVIIPILEEYSGRKAGQFGVCVNPEFLREGKAIEDTMNPDRIVIGSLDKKSGGAVAGLYKKFRCPILRTDLRTAEMIKYASNNFLATKISFINEISNVCEKVGVDVSEVARGVGLDHRIGPYFLSAGAGFGGSCLPKDVKALASLARSSGYEPKLLDSVLGVNEYQKQKVVEVAKSLTPLSGATVAVLGLAFKPETDDMRDAPSLTVIGRLVSEGAKVRAYDPKAMDNARPLLPGTYFADSIDDALAGSDLCIILTEWKQFRNIYGKLKLLKKPVVVDGRRTLDAKKAEKLGIKVVGLG